MKYIYLIKKTNENKYKIGCSGNPKKRLKHLQTASEVELVLIQQFSSNFPYKLEKMLHQYFNNDKLHGEWFLLINEKANSFLEICKQKEELLQFLSENNSFFDKI